MTIKIPFALLPVLLASSSALCGSRASAQAASGSQLDKKLDSPFAAFRIGYVAAPVASVDTGLDVTFPRLRIAKEWATRFDLDLSARFSSPSFGSRRDAEIAFALCQVYTAGGINRGRLFLGVGIGPSFGPRTGFGGKVFGGVNISPVVSIEIEGQFHAQSGPRIVGMLRLSAL